MNITKENTGDLTATITLEIQKADYEERVNKTLKEQQRKAVMPGFRPGKVPFGLIKKMYGKSALAEEVNQLLSENMTNYILENNLNVIGNPLPSKEKEQQVNFDEWGDFKFYFDIGLAPEFEFKLDDNIKIDYYRIKPDDKMIDEQISNYRMRLGSHTHPEKAGEEDVVQGELEELDAEGNVKEDGIKRKTAVSINYIKEKKAKKEFTDAERGTTIRFNPLTATDDKAETAYLLGVDQDEIGDSVPDFNFTITEITRQELAEMNADFFKQAFGEECDTEEKFRQKVAESISRSLEPESDRLFMNNIIEKLVKETEIPLPEDFLKRLIIENNKDGKTEEEITENFSDYLKSFKWQLIESKIIKEKDIHVQEEEIRNTVKSYFMNQLPGQSVDDERLDSIVDSVLQNHEEKERIHSQLLDDKMKKALKESVRLNTKEVDYEKFIEIVKKHNQNK